MLNLLVREPKLSVIEISQKLAVNFKTAAEYIRRLAAAGLITKHSDDRYVRHKISKLGESVLKFLKTIEP